MKKLKWFEFKCNRCNKIYRKKDEGFPCYEWNRKVDRNVVTKINICKLCDSGSSCIKCKTKNQKHNICSKCYINNKYGNKKQVIYLMYVVGENLFKIGRTDRIQRRVSQLKNHILLDTYILNGNGCEVFDGELSRLEGLLRKKLSKHRVWNTDDKRLDYFKSSVIQEFDKIGFSDYVKKIL